MEITLLCVINMYPFVVKIASYLWCPIGMSCFDNLCMGAESSSYFTIYVELKDVFR